MKFSIATLIIATSCITRSVVAECPFSKTGTPPAGHPSPQDSVLHLRGSTDLVEDYEAYESQTAEQKFDYRKCFPC